MRTLVLLAASQAAIMPGFSFLPMPDLALFGLLGAWSVCGWSFMTGQQVRLIILAADSAGVVIALNAAAIYVGAAAGSAIGGAVPALGWTAGAIAAFAAILILISRAVSGR